MTVSFPNESPEYRSARNALLKAEMNLRAETERVAAMRRTLPTGGTVPEDYIFRGPDGEVKMSQLFGDKPALFVYSFMYSPEMARACDGCSSFLDALNGQAPQLMTRVAMAVVAKSPFPRVAAYAKSRGWGNLPLLSSDGNSYNADYHGENEQGQQPMSNVFVRGDDGVVRHFWGCEMLFAPLEPKQHPRHLDVAWPLWNIFDLTPEGRGEWPDLPGWPGPVA